MKDQKPVGPHPRQKELDRRQQDYDDRGWSTSQGRHRPGAIHSRGGRA